MQLYNLQLLYETVQQNCHISDGLYGQEDGLCVYLLKMRELYRWEKKLPLTEPLSQQAIGEWLIAREQLWDSLEESSFAHLPINQQYYDPFETQAINKILLPQGIIYGAGYGTRCKPSFFIGNLWQQQWRQDIEILIADEEYARELNAPPAMSLRNTIIIRRESVRRSLWERIEEWQWKKPNNHLAQLLDHYQVEKDIETALTQMTNDEMENMIAHEIGEIQINHLLGKDWEQMLMALAGSPAERIARGVRDHLADCLVTLPQLLANEQSAHLLLLYWANLKGMRQALFPSLINALQKIIAEKQPDNLNEIIQKGQTFWLNQARFLLNLYLENPSNSGQLIIRQKDNLSF
jgi:hypothetical protein